jgi:cytosine/adenosine deaminase-related metal-dependent hydrolase
MKKIAANYVFPVSGKPIKNGILTIDNRGKILEISEFSNTEPAGVEFHSGVLVPGFVNAHCHLELPHIKGLLDCQKQGLPEFIAQIIKRRFTPDNLQDLIERSDLEMRSGGIVAVGDISNADDTFAVKSRSKIRYFTFVEVFTVSNADSENNFRNGKKLCEKLSILKMPGNIVPHAPYSIPGKLFELIEKEYQTGDKIVSVHNQETPSEDELFVKKSGKLFDKLNEIGFQYQDFIFSGKNGLETTLSRFQKNQNILLIHNTFTKETDIDFAHNYSENIYWVFCPDSNLFIEEKLPDIPMFIRKNAKICLGTDSYASNTKLDILSEMKTVLNRFSELKFEDVLQWATLNGASALKMQSEIGSFEIGKSPGINLISDFDFQKMKPTEASRIRVLG